MAGQLSSRINAKYINKKRAERQRIKDATQRAKEASRKFCLEHPEEVNRYLDRLANQILARRKRDR